MVRKKIPYVPSFRQQDLIKEGWMLVENVTGVVEPITDLEPVSFSSDGKRYVEGEIVRQYAREIKGNFGHSQAEYLFKHQDKIPADWCRYSFVFPGTIWRDPAGDLRVIYLYYWLDDKEWSLGFDWLIYDWDSFLDRLLHLRK